MKLRSLLNLNTVGMLLLAVGFLVSLGVVVQRSMETGALASATGEKRRVIQVMHWQLEPGYREAMQGVIDEYNALPHVVAANAEVRQLDMTERVYAQVLNVHAVSGTAPDICQRGQSALVQGSGVGRYFEGLGTQANEPNPYNAPDRLPAGLDPELAELLSESPWRDTLIDGMQAGWVPQLQDFYAVPTSFFGSPKIYYNKTLFREARGHLRSAMDASPRPGWLADLFADRSGGAGDAGPLTGVVVDTPGLRAWVAGDAEPDTLGRMLMLCAAVRSLADGRGDDQLVPIAGSSYSTNLFATKYLVPFTSRWSDPLNMNADAGLTGPETWLGWEAGQWSLDDPGIAAFFACMRAIAAQFPAGFNGLDREQARRRFVNEQAAMIVSGAWDANSLFATAEGTLASEDPDAPGPVTRVNGVDRRDFRFEVGIMGFPMPGPGERWSEHASHPASDAEANGGGSYMVYQRSPNKDLAVDFLRYLTSFAVNERFNREADWLPIVVGATPPPRLRPFRPEGAGLSKLDGLAWWSNDNGNLGTLFNGQFLNFIAGDVDYEAFAAAVEAAASDPRNGARRVYHDAWQRQRDLVRTVDSLVAVQVARDLLLDEPDADAKRVAAVRQSAMLHNATQLRQMWHRRKPDEPFPSY